MFRLLVPTLLLKTLLRGKQKGFGLAMETTLLLLKVCLSSDTGGKKEQGRTLQTVTLFGRRGKSKTTLIT